MDTEYIYPTKGSRFRVAVKLTSIVAVIAAISIGTNAYSEHVAPLPICDQVPWARLALALVGLGLLVPAVLFGRAAWRIYLYRQFPPPGTPVFFRAKVQRGLWAFLQGASAALLAVISLSLLAYLAVGDTVQALFFGANPCGA
ncbi:MULTISPECIES: hypothetical protein [unclassified Pseudoxanthomonas]|uniref:hypothetical protein n=1 Tax=unclassified Pseudoxanthomonas TaxID=2645906 RepID=UPI00307E8A4D